VKVGYLPRVIESLGEAPPDVRRAFFKQVGFLARDLRHPSLHAKKYDEGSDLWQARVTRGWRFYFTISHDSYVVIDVLPHPK
jgi:mRNA interferase RelE/StbE